MIPRVQAILDKDRREWRKLLAVLDAHPDVSLHDPESPEWTARDVYTHLAHMMEWTARAIETASAGQARIVPATGKTEDGYNAELKRRYQHLSLSEAKQRAQSAFEHRLRAIKSVPDDRWNGDLFEIASHDGADHFHGHRNYIAID